MRVTFDRVPDKKVKKALARQESNLDSLLSFWPIDYNQKILNFQDSYHNHLLKSANLGIGLCVILYLLFRL